MTYTAERPPISNSTHDLRARIPGWGVDLDPADRPAVPRERAPVDRARQYFPERQPEKWPRERSLEHAFLTPVFGTACPPRGISGALRRLSYDRYSEGRAAHWLLLVAADRVDALESHVRSVFSLRPDNPFTETGVWSEFTHDGIRSRLGANRADVVHHALDPLIVAGPWIVAGALAYRGVKAVARLGSSRHRM